MNQRQVQILKTLYAAQSFLTFGELANSLDVSVKTVRNDIAALRLYLEENHAGYIESKPHLGVRICINQQQWETLFKSGTASGKLLGEDREILFFILLHLLREGSLTAQRLAEQYYISRTQLEKILGQAEAWFRKNHIVYERRRGKGISIAYSEFNYRLAVLDFYGRFKEALYQAGPKRISRFPSVDDYEYTAMSTLLNGFDIDSAAQAIAALEAEFGLHLSYTSSVALLLLISLSVLRQRKGRLADTPRPQPCQTDGASARKMCDVLIGQLENHYAMALAPCEREFLLFAVSVCEIQGFGDEAARHRFEIDNIGLCRFTVKFAALVSEITGVRLLDDKFFVTQMLLQLSAMIGRLKYRAILPNPLLRQIKAKYPNMMAIAWSAGNIFEKELQLSLSEHEVGYLALHIGGAVERSSQGFSACIVCDYGVGISQILREKIERMVPDLRITAVLSNRDIRRIRREACDFIISTVPMEETRLGREVVVIGHLLDAADVEKIAGQMQLVRTQKRSRQRAKTLQLAPRLFSEELIFPALHANDKDELLSILCARLESLGYVTAEFASSVLDRERHTSTEVGRGIALPHGYSSYVNRSAVAFASLDRPISWAEEDDEVDLVFLLAFDLDEAKGMKDEIIKFYKSFVGFLEDADTASRLRALRDRGQILKLFENW